VNEKSTLPVGSLTRDLELSTLSAEVVSGPDAGKRVSSEGPILTVGTAVGNDLVLTDKTVSRFHAEFEATPDGIHVTDHRSTNGTLVGRVRIGRGTLPTRVDVQVGQTTLAISHGETRSMGVTPIDGIIGASNSIQQLLALTARVAASGASCLVIGESGTGKELVARALHDAGKRSSGPFVTVDCGAIAPNLVASELFGHERGSFTGAERKHIGAFERANSGTLFLDELGELPASLQSVLLGALERKRIRPVGGQADVAVDVRVIAATNRDLRAEVNEARFRLDLYYRLAVVTLTLPPLRERRDDIEALVVHFQNELCGGAPSREDMALFDEGFFEGLEGHHWPGNVRELRNLVEATLAMGEVPKFSSEIASEADDDPFGRTLAMSYKDARAHALTLFEQRYLKHWLDESGGNVAAAARGAKMDRSHLFHLLKRHDLRE
jgi:DNA-binding NtrC family response regulator